MLKKIFVTLLFLFLSVFTVSADQFFPDGDIVKNRYFDTLLFGIASLPKVGSCPGCIEYDLGSISGVYTRDILGSVSIDNVAYPDLVYGLVRIPGAYDRVSLPPFASVDFVYLYSNETGEVVNITELGVFLSTHNYSSRSLSNILDIYGDFKGVLFGVPPVRDMRYGDLKSYQGIGIVNNLASGPVVLDTVYVKTPLLFETWEVEFIDDCANLKVSVRNSGTEYLSNVEYEHGDFFLKRDFSAGETYIYEYTLPVLSNGGLGYPSLFNPNSRTECSVSGQDVESIMIGSSAVVYGVREKEGVYRNYVSSRTKPWMDGFCVTRIPYRLHAKEMDNEISDSGEEQEQDQEVLGTTELSDSDLKKLPQTGRFSILIYLPIFLVVAAVLCYYLRRRF